MIVHRAILLRAVLLAVCCAFVAADATGQEDTERQFITIEAEIISGLGSNTIGTDATGTSGTVGVGFATATGDAEATTTETDSGETATGETDAGAPATGETATGEQPAGEPPIGETPPGETEGAQTESTQTTEQVAARLMQAASSGSMSLADTAMVAPLEAGRRTNKQNLESLVTITVVDGNGNISRSTLPSGTLPIDVLGMPVRPPEPLGTADLQGVLAGDNLRLLSGITYFYVQVCSCAL